MEPRAPSCQETLPAASSWRSGQIPQSPASTASSPQPMRTNPTPQTLHHDHCRWLLQSFLNWALYAAANCERSSWPACICSYQRNARALTLSAAGGSASAETAPPVNSAATSINAAKYLINV